MSTDGLSFLNSLVNYERAGGYVKSLEPFLEFLASLGNPEARLRDSVLVVGTKGKGSVVYHMERAAINQGLRPGAYTSPHLVDITERIRLGGEPIRKELLSDLILEVKPKVRGRRGYRTFFEVLTACAFIYFAREGARPVFLEVGLGGRLDATRAAPHPITVITRIGLDHTKVLGDTLEAISREKALAVEPGGLVVSAPQDPKAMEVIRQVCRGKGAELRVVEPEGVDATREGTRFLLGGRELWTPALGAFQAENAALAAEALFALGIEPDFRGLVVPGRLHQAGKFVLDVAHNPMALDTLLRALRELWPGRRWWVVFGASRDKDLFGMLRLLSFAEKLILTRANTPRAAEPITLARLARSLGIPFVEAKTVADALDVARQAPDRVLVVGSVYLVGEALSILEPGPGSPPPSTR